MKKGFTKGFTTHFHILDCRPNQSETDSDSEPGSSVAVSTPSCPTQVGTPTGDDRGQDQIEVTPVSDTEQEQEDEPPQPYATDRGHFDENVLDAAVKRYIITTGSCKPSGPFPRNQHNRCFSEGFYHTSTKAGIKLPRSWLCYSPKLDCAYCEPCWLFGDRSSPFYNNAWVKGIRDWGHLSEKIELHESSQLHVGACMVYEQWKLHGTIDAQLERDVRNAALFWRQVLERIVNVTLTLATCNLSFRGHRDILGQPNSGNFLAIIELLASYDPVLQELIKRPEGSVKYLSPSIQNELIYILSQRVQQDITAEINQAPFFSVIMDTTQDLSKRDQLSQVYRYVTIVRNPMDIAIDVKVVEAFLGFEETADTSASELENKILGSITKNGLDISKCRGQGYDGAANMSGVYSGVQARIREKEPLATYVHCAAHNLNLALNDAVKNIPEMKQFYDTIEHLYIFFGHSIKRWAMLTGIISTDLSAHSDVTLKRLCPTRWSSRYESLTAIRYRYVDVMKALTKIALTSDKKDECGEAAGLKKTMEKFSFIFLVVLQTKVLESVNVVSKILQDTNTDIQKAVKLLENSIQILSEYRGAFDQAKTTAQTLADKWGAQNTFEDVRVRRVKRHFDELCEDERLSNAESYFRVNIFNANLDIIINQLSQRFTSMRATSHMFEALHPMTLQLAGDDELYDKAKRLSDHYNRDIAITFPAQLLSFRACFRAEIAQQPSVSQLAKMLIVDHHSVTSTFGEVCTALLLFLTLPVTVATAERSFSKLKLMKTYLRSSMGQERLNGLAILSIESIRARELNIKDIVEDFAQRKARRMPFK